MGDVIRYNWNKNSQGKITIIHNTKKVIQCPHCFFYNNIHRNTLCKNDIILRTRIDLIQKLNVLYAMLCHRQRIIQQAKCSLVEPQRRTKLRSPFTAQHSPRNSSNIAQPTPGSRSPQNIIISSSNHVNILSFIS